MKIYIDLNKAMVLVVHYTNHVQGVSESLIIM